jgi:hypothetical protein
MSRLPSLLLILPSKRNNCLPSSRPKSYQLLLHIFPTGFRAFVGIRQKVFTKMSTKAGYQEIFAEFVEGAKQSPAPWYSIKPLQNGIPSLADLLEVSVENLQTLESWDNATNSSASNQSRA